MEGLGKAGQGRSWRHSAGTSAAGIVDALTLLSLLKSNKRTGWFQHHVPHPESIADHSWRMAIAAMLVGPSCERKLDVAEAVQIAIVHDMAEALVGDITPRDGLSKDAKRVVEACAMRTLRAAIGWHSDAGKRLQALWLQYEHKSSPEGRLVKDLDKLEMFLTAQEYEAQYAHLGLDLSDFDGSGSSLPSLPFNGGLLAEVASRRQAAAGVPASAPQPRLSGGLPAGATDPRGAILNMSSEALDALRHPDSIFGPHLVDELAGEAGPRFKAQLRQVLQRVADRYEADRWGAHGAAAEAALQRPPQPALASVQAWVLRRGGGLLRADLHVVLCALSGWVLFLLALVLGEPLLGLPCFPFGGVAEAGEGASAGPADCSPHAQAHCGLPA